MSESVLIEKPPSVIKLAIKEVGSELSAQKKAGTNPITNLLMGFKTALEIVNEGLDRNILPWQMVPIKQKDDLLTEVIRKQNFTPLVKPLRKI